SNVPQTYYYNDLLFMDFQNHPEFHEDAGFLEVVSATINDEATEKLGAIYLDGNVYRKDVVAKSPQEIEDYQESLRNNIISNSNAQKEQRIKEISDSLILDGVYNETDIQTVLDNMDLYPIWESGIPVKDETENI